MEISVKDLMDTCGDTIKKIEDIDNQISEEFEKEESDKDKICKLRFEQMLQGLYLNQYGMNV
jgi:hypothetical protein